MSEIVIKLSWSELANAAMIGIYRHMMAVSKGLPDKHGREGLGWNDHVEGAAGEMAAAKACNLYWCAPVNTFKNGGDVGDSLQVRTRSRHEYELIVRPDDRDGDCFVLVTGKAPDFIVRGWMSGADAKQDDWWKTHGDRPGAWFVPQSALREIATIPEIVRLKASAVRTPIAAEDHKYY
jgi:hypothetical protein